MKKTEDIQTKKPWERINQHLNTTKLEVGDTLIVYNGILEIWWVTKKSDNGIFIKLKNVADGEEQWILPGEFEQFFDKLADTVTKNEYIKGG
ncbi:MAG: hypothetical protein GX452_13865 [Ignavibacteriales bacterium]|nr:hypothetical protein [Ignavibacteriales bacterium]